MRRTEILQEIRRMRFAEAYFGWSEDRLTQAEAARILGVCERTFRRYINRIVSGGENHTRKGGGGVERAMGLSIARLPRPVTHKATGGLWVTPSGDPVH